MNIAWISDYPLPGWTHQLLQGSAFWIGYKTQLYRHYPLTEGAIVGEAVSLIKGSLNDGYQLECEMMYKKLGLKDSGQTRADLIIKDGDRIDSVIEVKRAKAANKKVAKDLVRLAKFHRHSPNTRCFLLLVSQKERPLNYIKEDGNAFPNEINAPEYIAKVRRACKAASSFKGTDSAHYSCLIEVISK
jgi:hypothetical protein